MYTPRQTERITPVIYSPKFIELTASQLRASEVKGEGGYERWTYILPMEEKEK
jgi:hypothetical protein